MALRYSPGEGESLRAPTKVPRGSRRRYNPGEDVQRDEIARMEYDLIKLFDHPLRFRNCIPSAIVTFGGQSVGRYEGGKKKCAGIGSRTAVSDRV